MAQEVGDMKKRQTLWAVVFGSMLAITGCGDTDDGGGGSGGSGGSGASGGGSGSGFCGTLCSACTSDAVAECIPVCESYLGNIPPEFDIESCPSELDTWAECLGGNDCNDDNCQAELEAWAFCVVGAPF
jgi:hypothetical protein